MAPELRDAAEAVLREGESLSSFVEQSLRSQIHHRRTQQEFVDRGLASRDKARRTGEYFPAEKVLQELAAKLQAGEARRRK